MSKRHFNTSLKEWTSLPQSQASQPASLAPHISFLRSSPTWTASSGWTPKKSQAFRKMVGFGFSASTFFPGNNKCKCKGRVSTQWLGKTEIDRKKISLSHILQPTLQQHQTSDHNSGPSTMVSTECQSLTQQLSLRLLHEEPEILFPCWDHRDAKPKEWANQSLI